jgi:hypothetical protein
LIVTDATTKVVQLDDLAIPRYSAEAQQIRDMMASVAPQCSLDFAVMHDRARADTGLVDFGPDDYRERLELYLSELRDIDMHGPGIVNFYSQLVQWLKNRLLLADLLKRHPEIHDIEVLPPVVIAGLPRTGTTHLHNMLAAAPTFRSLPYWESVEPFPLAAEAGQQPDPRVARMDMAVGMMDTLMPHFALMHEMTTDHAHEEIHLLANDFSTMLMDTLAHVPRWTAYYWSHDQTSSYEYMVTQLKALQFLRGGRRWVLKSPQHLGQLPVLDSVLPGVIVAFTHRDPAPVALSMITMITYAARMYRDQVGVAMIADAWVDNLDHLLESCVRDRDVIPADRSVDIRFDDFMTDEVGVAERLYGLANEPFTDDVRNAIDGYLLSHRRGRHGRVATSPELFGLDEADLRARFATYTDRFLS